MFIKFAIFMGIGYLGYRAAKSWFIHNMRTGPTVSGGGRGEIHDEMIKDPFCGVYFPQRDGVHLRADGRDLYFCSAKCRDEFTASNVRS